MDVIELFPPPRPADWTPEMEADFQRHEAIDDELAAFGRAVQLWDLGGAEPDPGEYPALVAGPLWEVIEAAMEKGRTDYRVEIGECTPWDPSDPCGLAGR